ncbi:MAG: CGLD27 family protein, partial [Phycisphaerales bacterium]
MIDAGGEVEPEGLLQVPPEQRPLRQYNELCQSWFFAWPSQSLNGLLKPLAISWLLVLPLTVLV